MTMTLHVKQLGTINPVININCYADTTVRINAVRAMDLATLRSAVVECIVPVAEGSAVLLELMSPGREKRNTSQRRTSAVSLHRPNKSFQRTVKKLRLLPSAEFTS